MKGINPNLTNDESKDFVGMGHGFNWAKQLDVRFDFVMTSQHLLKMIRKKVNPGSKTQLFVINTLLWDVQKLPYDLNERKLAYDGVVQKYRENIKEFFRLVSTH